VSTRMAVLSPVDFYNPTFAGEWGILGAHIIWPDSRSRARRLAISGHRFHDIDTQSDLARRRIERDPNGDSPVFRRNGRGDYLKPKVTSQ